MMETISNIEAERALIGSLLVDPTDIPMAADNLVPDDFYHLRWRNAFVAMVKLYNEGVTDIDPIVVADKATSVPGDDTLQGIMDAMSIGNNLMTENYVEIVKDTGQRRSVLEMAERLAQMAFAGEEGIEEMLIAAGKRSDAILQREDDMMLSADEMMSNILDKALDAAAKGGVANITTGFDALDEEFTRIRRGELVVPAARPGHGKTALMVSMMDRMLDAGLRVMFFSAEMRAEDIGGRLLAYRLSRKFGVNVSSRDITEGRLRQDQWSKANQAMGEVSMLKNRLTINRTFGLFTPGQIRNKINAYELRHGCKPDVVFIDYIGLMDADEPTRSAQERVSSITRELKKMPLEMDIAIVAASQLNRAIETRAEKRPVLSDLRDSGSTEQDADRIWFIYRSELSGSPDARPNIAEVFQEKMREGPTGQLELYFSGTGGFRPLAKRNIPLNSEEVWSDELQSWQREQSHAAYTAGEYDDI